MTYWKVFCEEDRFPGMWRRWFKDQCVALGFSPKRGHLLYGEGGGEHEAGWKIAKKALERLKPGDIVAVQLHGNQIGRIGEVIQKRISDGEWNPTVPPTRERKEGRVGRRIEVRWNLNVGPADPDTVVTLPEGSRLNNPIGTIAEIPADVFDRIEKAMKDESNWTPLYGLFHREKSISDYIATYPHQLEDELVLHPSKKVREWCLPDKTRPDVVLMDGKGTTVIVECKQGAPTVENIDQLYGYMKHIGEIDDGSPRGILVHGGSASLTEGVRHKLSADRTLKLVRYNLSVGFVSSS
jgi:hypothetical protein